MADFKGMAGALRRASSQIRGLRHQLEIANAQIWVLQVIDKATGARPGLMGAGEDEAWTLDRMAVELEGLAVPPGGEVASGGTGS